jgi:putative modified peptide
MQAIVATSTQATTQKKRSAPLDPKVADKLLDLLSTDNGFRRLFKRNPGKALEQVGFVGPVGTVSPAGCFYGITKLAAKPDIIKARAELTTMLTGGLAYTPPALDAAGTGSRRNRK